MGRCPRRPSPRSPSGRSEEHTSELQSLRHLVCRLLLEKKKKALTPRIVNQAEVNRKDGHVDEIVDKVQHRPQGDLNVNPLGSRRTSVELRGLCALCIDFY